MFNTLSVTRAQEWNNLDKIPEQFKDANITELRLFKQVKDNMTINDQSLRNNHIVRLKALWDRTSLITHEGHQGLVKANQLLC